MQIVRLVLGVPALTFSWKDGLHLALGMIAAIDCLACALYMASLIFAASIQD